MSLRLDYRSVNKEAFNSLLKFEELMSKSGLDKKLYELIKIRASQINGCAFCLDMHTKDLREMGETEQRINLISVWREAHNIFTDEEKAVLELTEAVTLISSWGVQDELYDKVRTFFDEKQYVDLIMAIITINSWNRIAVSTGMYPGCY